jgi:glutathione S-transferase
MVVISQRANTMLVVSQCALPRVLVMATIAIGIFAGAHSVKHHVDQENDLHEVVPPKASFRIFYQGVRARADPLLRMCAERKHAADCQWQTDMKEVVRVVSCREGLGSHNIQGTGAGDTFAPPVLQDLVAPGQPYVSQSVATSLYLAEKIGFGVSDDPLLVAKAVQYMTDLNDLRSELIGRWVAGRYEGDSWQALRTWTDGGRLASWLENIERSVAGPYYMGGALTAPDFYLVSVMDYFEAMHAVPLSVLLAKYERTHAVYAAVTGLPSWRSSAASSHAFLKVSDYLTPDELLAYNHTKMP